MVGKDKPFKFGWNDDFCLPRSGYLATAISAANIGVNKEELNIVERDDTTTKT